MSDNPDTALLDDTVFAERVEHRDLLERVNPSAVVAPAEPGAAPIEGVCQHAVQEDPLNPRRHAPQRAIPR